MRPFWLRLVALLLVCLLLLPSLGGCAQFEAYRLFFTGEGTKDPAAGAVTPPAAEELTSLTLGYDESYTLTGTFLSLEDVVTNDEALLVLGDSTAAGEDGAAPRFTVRSVGVGTATLVYEKDGAEHRLPVTVKPAQLALFFLLGDRDARGVDVQSTSPLRAPDGRVYYTFPEYADRLTPETADEFVVERLTENYFSKGYTNLYCWTNELTTAGRGRYAGLSAPLSYKWTEQTGEHVWIVNMAEAGASILDLLPDAVTPDGTANDYACLLALFASICETLTAEYDAGHYTHARTGYFLAEGEQDAAMSAADYLAALTALHTALKKDLTFAYPLPGSNRGEVYELDFGGIIGTRASRTDDRTMAEMTGPRTAQLLAAGAGGDLSDLYLLNDTASAWYSDTAVEKDFAKYDRRKFILYYGYEPPRSISELVTVDGAYTEKGLNELAASAVEALLYQTGLRQKPAVTPTLSLLAYNGTDTVGEYLLLSYGTNTVAAVPSVSPLWMAKEVAATVTLTAAKTVDLCRISYPTEGETVSLSWSGNGVAGGEKTLPVRRLLQFAFSDYPAELREDPATGNLVLQGYSPIYSCGYIGRTEGTYTPYPALNYRTGWLYDGRIVWGGHGGVRATAHYLFGPEETWDSAYAFTAPAGGQASLSFNAIYEGKNDYLLAICLNGKPIWPQAADSTADSSVFYTVRTDTSLEEINAAVAALSFTLRQGDVLTFVCRRSATGLTAEGAVHPVVTIEP